MAAKPDPSSKSLSGNDDVKDPSILERAKEELEAILHNEKINQNHHKETHGLRDDIDADTSMTDVKAPNVFQRAKEEIEAIVEAIHHTSRKESKSPDSPLNDETSSSATKDRSKSETPEGHSGKSSITKDEMKSPKQKPRNNHHHHHRYKETHGRRDDIDENTPIGEIKGPSVFERAKEEIEALIEAIHPHNHNKD